MPDRSLPVPDQRRAVASTCAACGGPIAPEEVCLRCEPPGTVEGAHESPVVREVRRLADASRRSVHSFWPPGAVIDARRGLRLIRQHGVDEPLLERQLRRAVVTGVIVTVLGLLGLAAFLARFAG